MCGKRFVVLLSRSTAFHFLGPCKHIGKNLSGRIGKDLLAEYFRVKQQPQISR